MRVYYAITERKPRRWFSRKSSRQMSATGDDYYRGEVEYAAAVAAAAFAISTLESATRDQTQQSIGGPQPFLETVKSQKEIIAQTAKPDRPSKSSSDEETMRKVPSNFDTSYPASGPLSEKIIHPVPSIKRRPTFSGSKKYSEDIQSMHPEIDTQIPAFPSPHYPPVPPPPPPPQLVAPPTGAKKPKVQESEADAWERAQLDKIRKRYEDLNITILEWEDKRKRKAKSKLDKTEGELDRERAKALQNYQTEIERINQIADGAQAQAKEKRRKEELKVKEKANKYRATGKPPATCLCF